MRVTVPRSLPPIPHTGARSLPPALPRRGAGPPPKRPIPHVKKVLIVSSAKGGVGKSTLAVNLATALARTPRNLDAQSSTTQRDGPHNRVGLLDLDIYGPSLPKLMNLDRAGAPLTTEQDALIPLVNYGMPCMSMGFLLPPSPSTSSSSDVDPRTASNEDSPVVWRGLMVMKAVQQLLFDVDWRASAGALASSLPSAQQQLQNRQSSKEDALDLLVIDTPPGTGDVHLSLAQLVAPINGVLVVSTPQKVALADTRKGIAMWNKLGIQVTGLVLNMSHLPPPSPDAAPIHLFGPPTAFNDLATATKLPVLGRIPIDQALCEAGEQGVPLTLQAEVEAAAAANAGGASAEEVDEYVRDSKSVFMSMASRIWRALEGSSSPSTVKP
ncbi:hypothetical protein OC846_002297 [Tilletia horrida]|uniref:P-loop containing nucleoside triphosphate hydrolase protein n=1 Tax=Tilletia horrida TaxID=155126 RepID=A0AAN6JV34_9BASI|nr:hypothetical protein OC846_002297 [Tilletia horrida]